MLGNEWFGSMPLHVLSAQARATAIDFRTMSWWDCPSIALKLRQLTKSKYQHVGHSALSVREINWFPRPSTESECWEMNGLAFGPFHVLSAQASALVLEPR